MFTSLKNNPISAPLSKWWPLLYVFIVTALLYVWFANWGYDDPYISYRYANNLAGGNGFVFNMGEKVLSTTTPLFTILLALLSPWWEDLPRLANLISAISIALGALFIWDLAHSWKTPAVGWTGLLLYSTFPLLITTTGSETPLYVALCLGAFAFYARGKYNLTAIIAALAFLARPDGILVAVIISTDYIIRVRRPIPWRAIGIFLLITLPWFIFAWIYFGYPLPVTLAAKQSQGSMTISQSFAAGLVGMVKSYVVFQHYRVESVLVVIGLIYLVSRSINDRPFRRWFIFLGWIFLYFASYSLLGVSQYFWYYAPLVPGLVVLIGLGATGIVSAAMWVQRMILHKALRFGKPISLTGLATTLSVIILIALALSQVRDLNRLRFNSDNRIVIYRAVGEWLASNTPPDTSVGTLEVGIIGYLGQRRMIDFAGLIQPEIAAQFSINSNYEDTAIWASEEYDPQYLIIHENAFPKLMKNYIKINCEQLRRFNADRFEYTKNMYVYKCEQ